MDSWSDGNDISHRYNTSSRSAENEQHNPQVCSWGNWQQLLKISVVLSGILLSFLQVGVLDSPMLYK